MRVVALACMLVVFAGAAAAEVRAVGDVISGKPKAVAGDTLDIGGKRIRLWGIDAPDRGAQCVRDRRSWKPAGKSMAALAACLRGTTVRCRVQRVERRRYVAECWRDSDDQDVAACMVSSGWATDAPGFSGAHYAALEAEPKASRRGLWACSSAPPTRRWCAVGVGLPCEPIYAPRGVPRSEGVAQHVPFRGGDAAVAASPPTRIPNCGVQEALKQAAQIADEFVGQGWKAERDAPWQLGQATAALSACGFAKGPRWADLERRALTFRHPTVPNVVLMKRGHDSLAKDTLGLGLDCQCGLALQHLGPRGTDLDGILKLKEPEAPRKREGALR